jgi:ELWxxDGT repeat protein
MPATAAAVAELLAKPVDLSDPAKRAGLVAQIRRLEDVERAAVQAKARQLGLPITGIGATGRRFVLRGFEGNIPLYEEPDNANAAISTTANLVRLTAPYQVDGTGLTVGLWESGGVPRLTHQEFGGKVTVRDGSVSWTDHATHVAGTLAGLGVNPTALGMAPAAAIHAYDSSSDVSEMLAAGAAFAGEAGKILISNHSYGTRRGWYDDGVTWLGVFSDDGDRTNDVDYGFGRYDAAAATLDGMAYNLPYYLAFFSNGNMRSRGPPGAGVTWYQGFSGTARAYDPAQHPAGNGQYKAGYDTMDGRKTAKNILSIGAANDAVSGGQRHLPSSTIASFSSSGPTDDGRIKPDVVANGVSLTSAGVASDSSYYSSSGTSMSTPNAAGSAMLLADLYQRRFPGQSMRASTLKGLIVHTADDIGIAGPDYLYGWGLMNTEAAAKLIEKQAEGGSNPTLIENVLSAAQPSQTYTFTWNGTDPIRVTLCWTDPPSTSSGTHDLRSPALVNDLNLTVTAPGGATHLPFVMPYVGDWSVAMLTAPAERGVNHVDNVEQVLVESPSQTGVYTVTVNHAGSLTNGTQPYSVILSGGGVPDELQVMPIGGFVSSGDAGGPFTPVSKTYTLRNQSASAEAWTASVNQPWLSVSAAAGTVAAGGEAEVTVALTAAAADLPVGMHEGTLTVVVGGKSFLRPVSLQLIGYPQLAVEQPEGTALGNGADLDFGNLQPGARLIRRLVLRNTGNQTLNLGSIALSGAAAAEFSLTLLGSSTIPAGGRTHVDLTLAPLSAGLKTATLSLPSDDAANTPFLLQLVAEAVFPGEVRLTRPINPLVGGISPLNLLAMNGYALFSGTTPIDGAELWRSDGTAEGTSLVKDIYLGMFSASPAGLVRLGDVAYFSANNGPAGIELWRSDGTEAGTYLLKDINADGNSSSITGLTVVGGTLFFRATTSVNGAELWKSDGTSAGTVMVLDIFNGVSSSSPSNLTDVNGTLFFSATTSASGIELWKSDGTGPGTVMIKDINAGSSSSAPSNFLAMGGMLYFTASDGPNGTELWKSDGTAAGTVMVKDINPGSSGSSPMGLVAMNGMLYFRATTSAAGYELWRSDGTEAGTVMVKDLQPGTGSGLSVTPVVHDGRLFFSGSDGALGAELWVSDGTEAGTVLLKDLYAGGSSSTPQGFIRFGDQLLFSAFTAQGREIWRTDGTAAGTVQVKDISPGSPSSTPSAMTDIGSCILFSADDGLNGRELWRSDGTEAGTWMVKDGNPNPVASTAFGNFRDVAGTLYFGANNGTLGLELWRSDGTAAGTSLVKDINSGSLSSNPANMTALPGGLVFTATPSSSTGTEPHFSDGTTSGTQMLLDIAPGSTSSSANNHLSLGGAVFFSATNSTYGNELWKSDGTTAGTVLVKDIYTGGSSASPAHFCDFKGVLFFAASNGTNGTELWRSDGTAAGTYMVKDIVPGSVSSFPQRLTAIGDWFYFTATESTSGYELWRSDGTAEGTVRVIDLEPGTGGSAPALFTLWNGAIYFSATTTATGLELWKTDGTAAGTVLVKDIQPGSASSQLSGLTALPNGLIFSAAAAGNNVELWRSDGTAAGTVLLKEIFPGAVSSSPGLLTRLGVHVYFRAYHPDYGGELWRTDGTEAGTMLVEDIYQGPSGSLPPTGLTLTVSGSKLYFPATHSEYGLQLFHIEGFFPPRLAVEKPAGTPRESGASLDLGAAFPGFSSPHVLTLRNTGNQPLQISAVNKSGTDAAAFNLGSPGQTTLQSGESTALTLSFQPSSEGIKTARLEIHSNDPDTPVYELNLAGVGIGAPSLRVEQPAGTPLVSGTASVSFSSATLGAPPVSRSFTLINEAPGTQLDIGAITVSGPQAADFRIVRGGMNATLAGGAATTFAVEFAPQGTGARTATLSLVSNDPDSSPFLITVTGSGSAVAGPSQSLIVETGRPRRAADGPFPLQAFATSGLPLSYEVLAGPASVDGSGLVTPTGGSGAVTLRIRQAGGSGYNPVERLVTFLFGNWPAFTRLFSGHQAPAIYAMGADGTLWTWGYSAVSGYLGASVSVGRVAPAQVGSWSDWVQATPGNSHGLGLRANGSLWAWGGNTNGQLGDGSLIARTSPVQVGVGKSWTDVSAGSSHSAAVASDGTLWTWGYNLNGQLGLGDTTQRTTPTQVGTATHWRRVVCGSSSTLALTTTGEIWAWGLNSSGQLGIGNTTLQTAPVRVGSASNWTDIAAGGFHAFALRADGTLWAWGTNASGALGDGTNTLRTSPVQVGSATDWQSVRAGNNFSVARKTDGSVWAWGLNTAGQLGDGTLLNRNSPQRFAEGGEWRDVAAGHSQTAALREDGTVWVAGECYGFTGVSPRTLTPVKSTGAEWQQLSTSGSTYLARRADGTLWGWGYGGWGTLGNGSTADRFDLVQIGSENQWAFVEVGSHNIFGNASFAIKTNGSLWAAGYNANANLGDGTVTQRSSFVQIGSATDWQRVSAGQNHGLGLKTNGSLWAWGLNTNGQLGDGTTATSSVPKQIGSDTDWAQVAGGYSHSLALKTDGSLWGWGFNGGGQLGLGDTQQSQHSNAHRHGHGLGSRWPAAGTPSR